MRDILILLLLLSLAFGGLQTCRHGNVQDERDRLAVSLTACKGALLAVDSAAGEELGKAASAEKAGREAAERSEQAESVQVIERVRVERVLVQSKGDLNCAEQLEVTLCPAIPLL